MKAIKLANELHWQICNGKYIENYASCQDFLDEIKMDWQEFIEKYMDDYTHDDRVLWSDIALRYLDGDLEDEYDIKWIEGYGDRDAIEDQQSVWDNDCFAEALENWMNQYKPSVWEYDIEICEPEIFKDDQIRLFDCQCFDGFAICVEQETGKNITLHYPLRSVVICNDSMADEVLNYRGLWDLKAKDITFGDIMMCYGKIEVKPKIKTPKKKFSCLMSNVDGVLQSSISWPLSAMEYANFKEGYMKEWELTVIDTEIDFLQNAKVGDRKYYRSLRNEPNSLGIITRIK